MLLQNAFKKYSMCELLAVNGNFDCRHTTLTGPLVQPRSLCIILRNAFAPPPPCNPSREGSGAGDDGEAVH